MYIRCFRLLFSFNTKVIILSLSLVQFEIETTIFIMGYQLRLLSNGGVIAVVATIITLTRGTALLRVFPLK